MTEAEFYQLQLEEQEQLENQFIGGMMNKTAKVLAHLKKGNTITSWQAIQNFRATRLADIVFRLRGHGFNIATEMIEDGKMRYARYRMMK
jgi:hypothetical protein